MSKHQEIKEHIATEFKLAREEGVLRRYADGESDAIDLIDYLHSQGVVIKSGDTLEEL